MRVGLMTCYDLRFPELALSLALSGAQLLILPTAWVKGPLKEHHWSALLAARAYLGKSALIGVSCYNRLELALEAAAQGADYLAFGSFFPSPTKPNAPRATLELLQHARQQLTLPICAIGGITLETAPHLLANGADMLAVITDVFNSPNIAQQAARYQTLVRAASAVLH